MPIRPATAVGPGPRAESALRSPAAPLLALACALLAFLALYLYLLRNVGLANDEWYFLLYRPSGFQTIVFPYNNGPVVGEILLYRWWASSVGVAHHWVLSLLFGALQAAVAVLVYAMARRRIGPWPALGVAVLVICLGRAWETILFGATLTFVAPALAGCAAWTALDRGSGWPAQLAVSILLALAAVTGGLAPALLVGLLVEITVIRRWRWLWPLAVGAVPLIMWYAYEAGNTGTHLSANLPHLPLWAAKYLLASAGAVFGLPPPGGIAVLLVAATMILWWRRRSDAQSWSTPRAVGLLTTLAIAVVTIGAARAGDTPPSSSRYLYFPAILMLLLACEWSQGLTVPHRRLAAVGAAVIVAVAVGLGVQQLRSGKVFYLDASNATAARMGAMELAHGPPVVIEPTRLAYTPAVLSSFIRRYGSAPIDTESRLAGALPESRVAADRVLAAADVRSAGRVRSCQGWSSGVPLPRRNLDVVIISRTPGSARLVRFAAADEGVVLPVRPPRAEFALRRDESRWPWRIMVPAHTGLRICAWP